MANTSPHDVNYRSSLPVEGLPASAGVPAAGGWRWLVCGLLFVAATICYIDRSTVAVLADTLKHDLNLDDADYGWVNFAFSAAYALVYPVAGRLLDLFGVRKGFALFVIFWSFAAMGHALVGGVVGLCVARFFLGVGEAANFPASIKAVAEWFPKQQRALATGIFNSGSNVGICCALFTVWIAMQWHWQAAFVVTGALGFIWVVLWYCYFRPLNEHPYVTEAEKNYIRSGQAVQTNTQIIPWTIILRQRAAWPFLLAKFLTDPVWWFYLYWLPLYLTETRGVSKAMVPYWLIPIYVAASFGSIIGGWLSGFFMSRNWPIAYARYAAMGACAFCMPCAIYAIFTGNFYIAMAMICLATAGHQGWSANLYTTSTDIFPTRIAGSINGLGGTFGAIGGMFITLAVGMTLQWLGASFSGFNKYIPIFIWAGLMHPLALVLYIWILGRKFPEIEIDPDAPQPLSRPLILAGILVAAVGMAGLYASIDNFAEIVKRTNAKLSTPTTMVATAPSTAPATPVATSTSPATTSAPAPKRPNQSTAAGAVTFAAFTIALGIALIYAALPKGAKPKPSGFPVA
jgi:ACS family hexuronate transporter-like MFS transporter